MKIFQQWSGAIWTKKQVSSYKRELTLCQVNSTPEGSCCGRGFENAKWNLKFL